AGSYYTLHVPSTSLVLSPALRRCSPLSSLLPYTTLFRSRWRRHAERDSSATSSSKRTSALRGSGSAWPGRTRPSTRATSCSSTSDRKSTRLNSSHVSISYAVFCLKKKNTEERGVHGYRPR